MLRYRRILSVGDVLDEGIALFRHNWVNFALVSAVALIPPGLLQVWLSASSVYSNPISLDQIRSGRFAQAANADPQAGSVIALSVISIVISGLFYCLWSAAMAATAEAYVRGGEPRLPGIYGYALRRFVTVLLGTLIYALALAVLWAFGSLLFVLTVFGGLGGIIPGIGLLVWWLRPSTRQPWLKWLIIVCAPFGLLLYFATRWSMYIAAAIIERRDPVAALIRSSELTDRHVFRVMAILTVSSVIVGVFEYTPLALISIPLAISSGLLTPANTLEAVATVAVGIVLQVLFQSVGAIIYTLMFLDLRNRRDGSDLAERLTQVETAPVTASG